MVSITFSPKIIPGVCQADHHLLVSSVSPADGRERGDGFESGLGMTGPFYPTSVVNGTIPVLEAEPNTDGLKNDRSVCVYLYVSVAGINTVFPVCLLLRLHAGACQLLLRCAFMAGCHPG